METKKISLAEITKILSKKELMNTKGGSFLNVCNDPAFYFDCMVDTFCFVNGTILGWCNLVDIKEYPYSKCDCIPEYK